MASDELIVDPNISAACANYSIETSTCLNGDARAFPTPAAALSNAHPGDKIMLRHGEYGPIDVAVSGSADRPIEISPFNDEQAVITSADDLAFRVIRQSDIVIRDLVVRAVRGFGRVEESTRIEFAGIRFEGARSSGTSGALKFVRSSENKVTDSTFESGSDLLILQDASDRNLILGNRFGAARHSLISIRCSGWNIVRGNEFANPRQKAMEIYDCQGISDAPVRLDSTVRNIVEHNWFRQTAESGRNHKFNAIQHGGQRTIVRYNVFSGNLGGGVNFQFYPDESLFVHGNRLYNNTFLENRCGAIIAQRGARGQMYDNVAANNLLFGNVDCTGSRRQINVEVRRALSLRDNLDTRKDPGLDPGDGWSRCPTAVSPVVDAGGFATRTRTAGSGTLVRVEDASWFSDGYGIQEGDTIQFSENDRQVLIIGIDDESQTIELAEEMVWRKGQGVHLAYFAAAPDQGAYEFGSPQCDNGHKSDNSI